MHPLQQKLNSYRLADNLWELVNIPSPTCNERDAAFAFARLLRQAGATVEIDESLPQSPSVIGRLRGSSPGPVLQLAGHLDHIDIPHARRSVTPRRSADEAQPT
ncbi:MAG: hypothetical protein ACE15E_03310 [Acidobacteriota bacterium]